MERVEKPTDACSCLPIWARVAPENVHSEASGHVLRACLAPTPPFSTLDGYRGGVDASGWVLPSGGQHRQRGQAPAAVGLGEGGERYQGGVDVREQVGRVGRAAAGLQCPPLLVVEDASGQQALVGRAGLVIALDDLGADLLLGGQLANRLEEVEVEPERLVRMRELGVSSVAGAEAAGLAPAGDTVRIEIDGLGGLESRIIEDGPEGPSVGRPSGSNTAPSGADHIVPGPAVGSAGAACNHADRVHHRPD